MKKAIGEWGSNLGVEGLTTGWTGELQAEGGQQGDLGMEGEMQVALEVPIAQLRGNADH